MRHSTRLILVAAGFASTMLIGINQAQAAAYLFSCIPDASSSVSDCNIASAQILMDVQSVSANQVAFTFSNSGSQASSIEGVYFDDGTLLGISYLLDKDENGGLSGVDFTGGSASPGNLPRSQNLAPAFEVTAGFLADSDAPVSANGVNPNEWLTVVFDLQSGGTYNDVIEELGDGRLRVGLHVIAFQSGGSEALVNQMSPVPVPSALLLMLSGMVGFVGLRRKKIAGRCSALT